MGRELGDKLVPLKNFVYMRRSLRSARRDGGLRNLREDFEAQRFLGPLPVSGLRLEVDEEESYTEAHGRLHQIITYLRIKSTEEEEVDEDCNKSSFSEPLL